MNKRYLMVLTALIVLAVAGNASATRFETFEASGDCDGYLVEGSGKIGSANSPGVDVTYAISLVQAGEVLDLHEGSVFCAFQMDADPFTVAGSFAELPVGEFHIIGEFFMPGVTEGDSVKTFDIAMTCAEEPTAECRRPAFWRRHPGQWPVDSLHIGGRYFGKSEARDQMRGCFRYPVVRRLYRHLLAAKLNLANGADCGDIETLICQADQYLSGIGFHERLNRCERRHARRLKNDLREFNRGLNKTVFDEEDRDDFSDEMLWGDLKASYR